jgi:hypothetical protein
MGGMGVKRDALCIFIHLDNLGGGTFILQLLVQLLAFAFVIELVLHLLRFDVFI